jgi:hypothetical protein
MKLPQVSAAPALVTAPKSAVGAGDYQRRGAATAGTLGAVSDLLDSVSVPMAQEQARRDAMAEADITRSEDGSLTVQPRRDPMLVGKAADAYARTHEVAFETALRNTANTALQDLANKTWLPADQGGGDGDPDWFEKQANQYVTGIAEKQHGNQLAVQEEGNRIAGEYLRNLRQKKAAMDAQGAKATLDERMARLEDDLSNLAFSGVQGDAFTAKLTELETLRQTKASDPRMGYAAEAAKRDSELLKRDLGAQAIIGAARRDYQTDWNLQRVQQDAEKKLTELGLPPREMLKYMGEVNTHLRSTDAAIQQHRAELTAEADSLVERMKTSRTTDDRSVNELQDRLRSSRLYAKAAQLEAQRATNALLPVISTGPASAAAEALGRVRGGQPVTLPAGSLMGQPYTGSPQMSAQQVRDLAQHEVEVQGLVGTVPIDGPKFGIKTGSAAEWAAFMTRISNAESSHNNGDTYVESFKHDGKNVVSRGLYSLSEHDAPNYGLNEGQYFTPQQLANPNVNTAAAVAIIKKLVQDGGTIQGSIGRYWSTVRDGTVLRKGPGGQTTTGPGPRRQPEPLQSTPYSDNPVFKATVADLQKEYDARFKTLWGKMDSAWGAGRQPSQAEVNDLATLLPLVSDPDVRRTVGERLAVEGAKASSNGLDMTSLGEAVRVGETRAATGEASPLERQIADGLADQQKRRAAILDGHPADYSQVYLDPKATGVRLGALPLDTAETFAAGLQARQQAVELVKRQEPTAGANPLRAGEATNLAKLLPNAPGGQAATYVQTLAETLKPEQLAAALMAENKALAVAVKGMAMSGDPVKMSAAFALMDRVDRDNPDRLVSTFGEDSQKSLDVWNAKTQFRAADVVAKEMMARNEPSAVAARKVLEEDAHRLVFGKDGSGGMTAADIAGQFDTSLGGVKPNAWLLPESMTPALEQGMLRQDFARQFAAYYAEVGDKDQAAALAAKRIGQVWGVSPANGGRIMRYPPESRLKDVNGSKDYVREQLYADMTPVLQAMGTKFQASTYRGVEMPFGSAGSSPSFVLVADDKTKADIGAGRAPSYQVVALHEGEHVLVTNDRGEAQRWRPDEQATLGAANAKALEVNEVLSRRRQFDSMFGRHGAGSPAFYNARGER